MINYLPALLNMWHINEMMHETLASLVNLFVILLEFMGLIVIACTGGKAFVEWIKHDRQTRLHLAEGLAMALGEINEKYKPIVGITHLQNWADTAPALSNDAVAAAAANACCEEAKTVFSKALSWSKAVNASIVKLPEELKVPYDGTKEGLAAAHTFADVAMVSSANRDAVEEEWGKFGLLEHTDIVLAQDVGSKAACIAEMLKFGYELSKVVMIGDAPGDCDAAEKNGVWYYPILVNHERASWDEAIAIAFGKLQSGDYSEYEIQKKKEFLANLGG